MPGKLVPLLLKYSKPKEVTEVLPWILDFATNWDSEWALTDLGWNTQSKAQDSSTSTFSNQSLDKHTKLWNSPLSPCVTQVFPGRKAAAMQGIWGEAGRTVGLPVRTQDLDVHGRVEGRQDLSPFLSRPFVAGVDGARLPVRPVQSVPGQGQSKGMSKATFNNFLPFWERE